MSNLQGNPDDNFEQEISLRDVIDFIVDSWKTLVIFTIAGLVCAIAYLWITPNRYQATAQIQIAQFASNTNNINSIMSPVGVNVEEPARLVLRLQSPATYSDEAIVACGLKEVMNPREKLAKLVKATIPKAVTNVVELEVNLGSKNEAIACLEVLFAQISQTQIEIAEPFFDEIKKNLADNNQQIDRAKASFAKTAGGSSSLVTSSYLLARDEINRLADNNLLLDYLLAFKETRKTKLLAPIYASPNPVSPKKAVVTLLGLVCGLLIGLSIQFLKRIFKTQRNEG